MNQFDPHKKEQQLRQESASWDTSNPLPAQTSDIPVLDLEAYFTAGDEKALHTIAKELRIACEDVGFFSIIGHQLPAEQLTQAFAMVRRFHALPLEIKREILMDRPDWPVGGVGYLPVKNRKLPARDKGNLNEAFLIKCDHILGMDDNQWPTTEVLPDFREVVEYYAKTMEQLAKKLLPIFAAALGMPTDFFNEAFQKPLYRLRMTHYPSLQDAECPADEYGIAPHVDTSFCTILAQDQPGLSIFSERRQQWIQAPLLENGFVVNTGELLRQWTNDRFISTKHFANNNTSDTSRYSIPFFFNANPDYVMHCIPSCCGPDNPSKYPPISYAQSQGVVQGE